MRIIDVAFTNLKEDEARYSQRLESSRGAKSTLVVPADTDALEAARIADDNDIRLIIVSSSEGEVEGFLLPAWARRQIGRMQSRQFTTLTEALEAYEDDPKVRARNFHSERLNLDRPEMFWCNAGHAVDSCPCDVQGHEQLGCSADSY